jgi:hypothetical protein
VVHSLSRPAAGSFARPSQPPASSRKGKKTPPEISCFAELLQEHRHTKQHLLQQFRQEPARNSPKKSAVRKFLDSVEPRLERMSQTQQSYVQFQISTLLFNAENPAHQVSVVPLPATSYPEVPFSTQARHVAATVTYDDADFQGEHDSGMGLGRVISDGIMNSL